MAERVGRILGLSVQKLILKSAGNIDVGSSPVKPMNEPHQRIFITGLVVVQTQSSAAICELVPPSGEITEYWFQP